MPLSPLHSAIKWAAKRHAGQDRDGVTPLPYVTHCAEVLSNLRNIGGITDDEMLCGAALHDVIEMGGITAAKVEKRFGPRVRELVVELTRSEPAPESTEGLSKAALKKLRGEMLLDDIKKMSRDAMCIKLADRLSNLEDASRTKKGRELAAYLEHTGRILKIVPRSVNHGLWNAISERLKLIQKKVEK